MGVSICLQFGPLLLAVMIWQKPHWTQTETDYTALMPDNKDCKSTRGSFQSGYDNESAKSLSDICPESVHSIQLLKGGRKCHLECWMLELCLGLKEHNMFVMNSHLALIDINCKKSPIYSASRQYQRLWHSVKSSGKSDNGSFACRNNSDRFILMEYLNEQTSQ